MLYPEEALDELVRKRIYFGAVVGGPADGKEAASDGNRLRLSAPSQPLPPVGALLNARDPGLREEIACDVCDYAFQPFDMVERYGFVEHVGGFWYPVGSNPADALRRLLHFYTHRAA